MISVAAPAKLNLYLHVTGRRDDGYHLLDSLVAFAGVHDVITVESAPSLSMTATGPFGPALPRDGSNLVLRAAQRLREVAGISEGAQITLEKNLPVSSGIGGGSADAAAAIKALARMWGVRPGQHDLSGLALGLGADVPVCLFGRATFMGGVGEQLEPVGDLPDIAMVLVNPGVDVSTPEVFKVRRGSFSPENRFEETPESLTDLIAVLGNGRGNDLMAPAVSLSPVIGDVLDILNADAGCRFSRMSGSGATCFGFFESDSTAAACADKLRSNHPDWWVVSTRLISDCRRVAV